MSGVAVVRYLLANSAAITAVVPAARIISGDAPLATLRPLIVVTQIDSIPLNYIRTNEANKLHTDRVQVSWIFNGPFATKPGTGYPGVAAMAWLVLAAVPSSRGTINGVSVQNITPEGEGPDLYDDATNMYSRSRDFIVRWVGA
jgi:hypothetical protein